MNDLIKVVEFQYYFKVFTVNALIFIFCQYRIKNIIEGTRNNIDIARAYPPKSELS